MSGPGKVSLVGAGPGDPGLITAKGLALLQAADVVVHDRLINERLLEHARPDALLINAGKRRGGHLMSQDEINAALVEHGAAGKRVVRLKGGDPFVFGRGGEEALGTGGGGRALRGGAWGHVGHRGGGVRGDTRDAAQGGGELRGGDGQRGPVAGRRRASTGKRWRGWTRWWC